jgi:hypothetical protein
MSDNFNTAYNPEQEEFFGGVPLDINQRNPSNVNILLSTGFRFLLTRTPNITYFCQGVNLPDITLGEVEQPTRFIPIKHPGTSWNYGDLEISFIIDENMENWREIHSWMRSLKGVEDFNEFESNPTEHFSDASLVVLNSAMKPNLEVTFEKIFPKTLSGIQFTSDTTDSAQVIANATFAYTSYDIRKL